ncbi:DUF5056 domain-containing protein [Prevotella sp. lc2012]|jgi:hypothetical protein|uniref:DUF5056 domain-containing protein n=1 Tax=Prevotella sp. lc2012 TaxID=1761886 RepID=UPI000895CE4D|nr:DUF5056 domain-containing protein [Prevotella sp. lc2012]MBR5989393.1 DUF5056 domain-containing protein [Prevotella sp.]SEE51951.1 protein of unknown function [Prevotella sp. lc2012]
MTDKEKIMLEDFFKQAAQQQIEDRGFTERVMQNLPERRVEQVRRLSRLWTIFCGVVGVAMFFLLGGWQVVQGWFLAAVRMTIGWLEIFMVTAPTTEISINPWVVLLVLVFVIIFLPYQTARRLSSAL